ncbi:hypothetical protein CRE_29197 [Caenorhabditis remanei]|uniref:CX domain-containing protein n=1 Tax=Caenorhabditis remanei TaxID=31234 RepID=E3NFY5_CAERE|nr:hypothetical protein CRE_29197 [Caenorhabditis remanei]
MRWLLHLLPLLLYIDTSVALNRQQKRSDTMFLAMVCQEECEVQIRFLEHRSVNESHSPYEFTMVSKNGSLHETTMDVPEDVNVIEFIYTVPEDENGTSTVESDIWDLNFSETYFHSTGSLQVVGNLPCGKYGCPQNPLCDGGCRFTVIASLAAFCLSILAGLILQTVYVSFLGFRKNRKELELRDTLRLTESAEPSH